MLFGLRAFAAVNDSWVFNMAPLCCFLEQFFMCKWNSFSGVSLTGQNQYAF